MNSEPISTSLPISRMIHARCISIRRISSRSLLCKGTLEGRCFRNLAYFIKLTWKSCVIFPTSQVNLEKTSLCLTKILKRYRSSLSVVRFTKIEIFQDYAFSRTELRKELFLELFSFGIARQIGHSRLQEFYFIGKIRS